MQCRRAPYATAPTIRWIEIRLAELGSRQHDRSTGASCHNGVDVGGNSFRKFGVVEDYWKATGSRQIDKGRYTVTHDPADMYVFKVAMLRNVAMIPPYFHDGSVATLPQAVRVMARVQLGKRLADAQTRAIVGFLDSLTGPLPADFAASPVLPQGPYSEGR